MRDAFINTLTELAAKEKEIILVSADVGYSVLEKFQQAYPDRFFNVGAAEANAVGIAAGLALRGKIVYVYSFISFLVLRALEQVRVDIAAMKLNVRLVGVGAGLAYGAEGFTHHALEDVAVMRSLPNMTVFCPGDPLETGLGVRESVTYPGPMYIRLGKKGEPLINKEKIDFKIGKVNVVKEGRDLHLVSNSIALPLAMQVSALLQGHGLDAAVASMHTVKPLDTQYLGAILQSGRPVFSLEEHSILGGLGSALAEIIAESSHKPLFKRYGLPDIYPDVVGGREYLRECYGLAPESVALDILKLLGKT